MKNVTPELRQMPIQASNTSLARTAWGWGLAALMEVFLCFFPGTAPAETASLAWVRRYGSTAYSSDWACAMAVDASNNVVVAGTSQQDFATVKYSEKGVPLWTNRYGWLIVEKTAAAVAVDSSNSVVVAYSSILGIKTVKYSDSGMPIWTNRFVGGGNGPEWVSSVLVDGRNDIVVTGGSAKSLYAPVEFDYITIKYSSAGKQLWGNRYDGPAGGGDRVLAAAVDNGNNVIVTGYYATIKYSSAGSILWIKRYNGPGNGYGCATAVKVDSSNCVLVAGSAVGIGTARDFTTIKYSSAGVPLWTNRYNGPANQDDQACAVAVDSSNNVVVTGYSTGIGSDWDYATIKYSSAGAPLWTNRYNGPANGADSPFDIAIDRRNNVIVAGEAGSGRHTDYATIKYSSAGLPLWTNRYNGPANAYDRPYVVRVDRNNNILITGYSAGVGSSEDFATLKYNCMPGPVRRPVLTGAQCTSGSFQMRVEPAFDPGMLVIEASTNVSCWAPILTNSTPTNVLFFADPDAGNCARRFYRARALEPD